MSRKNKSVSFNLNDPFELELYNYSKQYPNFSLFVKRLIQNVINHTEHNPTKPITETKIENQQEVDIDLLKQLI